MNLAISKQAHHIVNNAVIVSGSARSGTTILGKIIHSFKNVEYAFEPPYLFSLIPLINKISKDDWKIFYETYLYEDFFLNAICGRNINCNKNDDSSIYNVKSSQEINLKLQASLSKKQLEIIASQYVLAYKMPDIVSFIGKIAEYYPDTIVVVMNRDAIGTINSLLQKKWFHDDNLKSNLIWPFRICNNFHVPFWVKENDERKWLEMSEIDRSAYYYIRVNEGAEKIQLKIDINYNDLVERPAHVVKRLSEKLSLQYGDKTEEIIAQIKPSRAVKDCDIVKKISPEIAGLVEFYSNKTCQMNL